MNNLHAENSLMKHFKSIKNNYGYFDFLYHRN